MKHSDAVPIEGGNGRSAAAQPVRRGRDAKPPHAVAVDWQGAHARIAAATQAMEEMLHPGEDRTREILDARANLLAGAGAIQAARGVEIEVVTFTLASERYAIESRFVLEVLKLATVTPLPRQRLLGVINLHGDILAVFDLRELLGVPTQGISDLFRIMVLGQHQPEFGVLTDTVDEVRLLRADTVLAPPGTGAAGHGLMRGVTSDALIVLDGELLLTDDRFFVDEGSQPKV